MVFKLRTQAFFTFYQSHFNLYFFFYLPFRLLAPKLGRKVEASKKPNHRWLHNRSSIPHFISRNSPLCDLVKRGFASARVWLSSQLKERRLGFLRLRHGGWWRGLFEIVPRGRWRWRHVLYRYADRSQGSWWRRWLWFSGGRVFFFSPNRDWNSECCVWLCEWTYCENRISNWTVTNEVSCDTRLEASLQWQRHFCSSFSEIYLFILLLLSRCNLLRTGRPVL